MGAFLPDDAALSPIRQETHPMSQTVPSLVRRAAALAGTSILAGLLLAGCATAAGSPTGGPTTAPSPTPAPTRLPGVVSGSLVLRIDAVGGFIRPEASLTAYPTLAVYSDGAVIVPGPVAAIFPGPLLPNLQVTRLTEAGLARLVAAATSAGLDGPNAQYVLPGPAGADSASLKFTFVVDGKAHTIGANQLDSTDTTGLDATVIAARAKLATFLKAAGDLATLAGSDGTDPAAPAPYVVHEVRIYATPGAQAEPASPSVAWPLATPLASFGGEAAGFMTGSRCGAVSGSDLQTLRPLLETASEQATWSSSGTWSLIVRPLLPDESGCPGG